MSKNSLPWIILAILFSLAMLGLGIRQGTQIGEVNLRNKISYEEKLLALTPTQTPAPLKIDFVSIEDGNCDVSYLLPKKISSSEAQIDIICEKLLASKEAELLEKGYFKETLLDRSSVYIFSEIAYKDLIRRTIAKIAK